MMSTVESRPSPSAWRLGVPFRHYHHTAAASPTLTPPTPTPTPHFQFTPPPSPPPPLPVPPTPTPTPRRAYLSGEFTLTVTTAFQPSSAMLPPTAGTTTTTTTPRKTSVKIFITADTGLPALHPHDPREPEALLEVFYLSRDIPAYSSLRRNMLLAERIERRIGDVLGVPDRCILALYLPGGTAITALDIVATLVMELLAVAEETEVAHTGRRKAKVFKLCPEMGEMGEVEARVHVLSPETVPPRPAAVVVPDAAGAGPGYPLHHHMHQHEKQLQTQQPHAAEGLSYTAHIAVAQPPLYQRCRTLVVDLGQPRVSVAELARRVGELLLVPEGGTEGLMAAGKKVVLWWAGDELIEKQEICEYMFVADVQKIMAGKGAGRMRIDMMASVE